MIAIDIFPWDDHFNTGLMQVDTQHRKLVELLNQLARGVALKSDPEHLHNIFDELLDYTVYHFETEEAIWEKFLLDDPMESKHKEVHQQFVDTVLRLKTEQNERSSAEIAEDTLGFLARWLASHILETDRNMAYIVLALEDGLDIEAAKEVAQQKMSGFTRTLIDMILSIYETLSANTLQLMYEIRNHKQLDEKVKYQSSFQDFLLNLSTSFINLPLEQINPAINKSLEQMATFVEADRAYIFDYDFEKRTMTNTYEWCASGITPQIDMFQNAPIDTIPEWIEPHIRGEHILIEDTSSVPQSYLRDSLESQEIKSLVTLPRIHENKCTGFIGFDAVRKLHPFNQGEIQLLKLFVTLLEHLEDRRRMETDLRMAANVFSHAREGIMITKKNGTIIDVNDAFTQITGYEKNEIIGTKPNILKSGLQNKDFYAHMWRSMLTKGHWNGELWNRRKNGELYPQMLTISSMQDQEGEIEYFVSLFSDITAIKEHERQLEHIAHYDSLTGLANRVLLADRLEQAMIQTSRHGDHLAVVYLDLDGFKEINDRYGHETGDKVLMAVAVNMKHILREGDTLSRLGGDEFVAVLQDLSAVDASVPTIERLVKAAAEPIQIGELVLEISASLGVTFYPQKQDIQADQLLRQADQAMYSAKQSGKNRFHLYDVAE